MRKNVLYFLIFFVVILSLPYLAFAENITILISGQSHSSLYPCSCPKNPSGGVARRSTLIKEIRNKEKNAIILEAGGSFAGGSHDSNSQNTELDKQRTEYYMQSLAKMGYDGFLVSSEEFNFGEDFLKDIMSKYKLNYLSANLSGNFKPYIIKKFGDSKVAIIGITDSLVQTKTKSHYISPEESLEKIIKEIKKREKANVVIVLSYLDEKESRKLIEKIEGIDIWVSSNNSFKPANFQKINKTMLVRASWEVRALTKINLDLNIIKNADDKKETESTSAPFDIKHIDLSKDFKDDPTIISIIPACFTDKNCTKSGFIAKCENPGTNKSQCVYNEIPPVKLTIIEPTLCKTCDIESTIERIKKLFVNLKIEHIAEDSSQAKALIDKLKIKMLPAYLIDESVEKENIISQVNRIAKKIENYYVLEPQFSGVSYFTNRGKIPNRLDVFFDIGTKDIVKILEVLQTLKNKRPDIDIHLNFLVIEDKQSGFIAKGKKFEIEEFFRSACISKHYPDKFWQYLSCRFSDIDSSWWDDCALKFNMDARKIKGCAQSEEGKILLREFIRLTQELEIVFGPTFLVNNQEVFGSKDVPSLEELENLFN